MQPPAGSRAWPLNLHFQGDQGLFPRLHPPLIVLTHHQLAEQLELVCQHTVEQLLARLNSLLRILDLVGGATAQVLCGGWEQEGGSTSWSRVGAWHTCWTLRPAAHHAYKLRPGDNTGCLKSMLADTSRTAATGLCCGRALGGEGLTWAATRPRQKSRPGQPVLLSGGRPAGSQ
jgi:hypothetical protein